MRKFQALHILGVFFVTNEKYIIYSQYPSQIYDAVTNFCNSGGPRKQLNCPHPNCKRNSGKGFSRQENLNEHLRRVHTPATAEGELISPNPEETEEETAVRSGVKRKRIEQQEQQPTDVRDDMARVIHENEVLRRQVELQSTQIAELMRQLSDVQAILNPNRLSQAPQAMMG